jgi:glucosylceramidase
MNQDLTWIATTQTSQWQSKEVATTSLASECKWDVEAQLAKPLQTIDGFDACFNELGWTSLSTLADEDRGAIFRELFAPGVGLNFNICRMPVGAR